MTVFTGDFQVKADAKGRFLFPSALSACLLPDTKKRFIIKKDIYENCLQVFTLQEWEKRLDTVRAKLNPFNKSHNVFLREFFKDTADVELDASGRMLIPKRLMEVIGSDKDLLILGLDTKIEIWSQAVYEASRPSADDFAALALQIFGGDI